MKNNRKLFENIFTRKVNPNNLKNWVDKCDYVIDNFKKYDRIYLIFEFEPTMFFCNYYLLDRFNDIGYKNIIIQHVAKESVIIYTVGGSLIWTKATSKKLKTDLGAGILPLHFLISDFSFSLVNTLSTDAALKNQGKKNRGVKKIYGTFKKIIEQTTG